MTSTAAPAYTIDERLTKALLSRAEADGVCLSYRLATRALAIAAKLCTPPDPGSPGALLALAVPPFVQSLAAAVWADRAVVTP